MSATGGNGSQPGREDYSPFIAPAGAKAAANAGDLSLLERLEALQLRPSEGWLTLGLVIVMVATIGLSLDDPQWVLGNGELTDFLAPVSALGVVWGFLSAKAGWSRWLAHFLGAVFAALIVPIAVGMGLNPADQSIGGSTRPRSRRSTPISTWPGGARRAPSSTATSCWSSASCAGPQVSSPATRSSATGGR